jgi:hypothetical protein
MLTSYNLDRLELFILDMGDLCDSPNSLRRHLAKACEEIMEQREAEGRSIPKLYGHWKPFLKGDPK